MQKIAFLLACLACSCNGLTPEQERGLATLLLASNKAAFNSLAPAGHRGVARRGMPQMLGDPKPLAPGTNYPTSKRNQMLQQNGFGNWIQKFQLAKGESKYGVPIFQANGEINPEYLAKERAEMNRAKGTNIRSSEVKRKKLIAKKEFTLADYIKSKIGNVGANRQYYNSGK
mmetsp:Transcript_167457/g.296481  ORF Transcript_167457/g.296481 Transcript_167457/m.296481 type:complete len:172 (-) Transcript_167457:205-720(-)